MKRNARRLLQLTQTGCSRLVQLFAFLRSGQFERQFRRRARPPDRPPRHIRVGQIVLQGRRLRMRLRGPSQQRDRIARAPAGPWSVGARSCPSQAMGRLRPNRSTSRPDNGGSSGRLRMRSPQGRERFVSRCTARIMLCESGYCAVHRRQIAKRRARRRGTSAECGYDAHHRQLRVLCFIRDEWRCMDCGWEPTVVTDFRQFELGTPPVEHVLAELRERFRQGRNTPACRSSGPDRTAAGPAAGPR